MTQQHTPGPWYAEFDGDPIQVGSEAGRFVAMTLGCDGAVGTAEDYANARLIAAAPELLVALKELEQLVTAHVGEEAGNWCRSARAAIAKAEQAAA